MDSAVDHHNGHHNNHDRDDPGGVSGARPGGTIVRVKHDTTAAQLFYCTIRITIETKDGKKGFGTGFLFDAARPWDPKLRLPLVVSNKHVLKTDAKALTFEFLKSRPDRSGPDRDTLIGYTVEGDGLKDIVGHHDPNVDVAVIPIAEAIRQLNNEWPYIRMLNWSIVPSQATLESLDAIEDLTFVGYPDGRRDPHHHTPIVRQAITSTPIPQRWDNKPAFLVDGSVFGGSSGSPVVLFNRGPWVDAEGNTILAKERLLLVGIIAQTQVRHKALPVEELIALLQRLPKGDPPPDPTLTSPVVQLAQELNLGVAFSAEAITDTLNLALQGFGYSPQVGTGE